MAIDPSLTGLPEDTYIDGTELVETLGRDGRKAVPISKLGGNVSREAMISAGLPAAFVDNRPTTSLLFNASSTGKARAGIAAGLYALRIAAGPAGLWNGASARLKVAGASGKESFFGPFAGDTLVRIVLAEVSTVRMEVLGDPFGLYAALLPPDIGTNGDPDTYFRPLSASVPATSFDAPRANKLVIGNYAFYADCVSASYAIQRGYDEKLGDLNHFRFECVPNDIPLTHKENDRAEVKSEYSDTDHSNCAPFGVPTRWAHSIMIEPGPVAAGEWKVIGQWHATEDNPVTSNGARAQDYYLSPVFAFELLAGDLFRVVTRTNPAEYQGAANATPTVHYQKANFPRGVFVDLACEIVFDWSGAAALKVWMDGVLIVNVSNVSIGYNDLFGPHYALGLYQAGKGAPSYPYTPETNRQAVQYANPAFDLTAAQLAARVANPPAIPLSVERQYS